MNYKKTKFYQGLNEKKALGIAGGTLTKAYRSGWTEIEKLSCLQWLEDNEKVGRYEQIVKTLINNGLLQKTTS